MDKKEIMSIIEGLLFTWGDPLDISDICSILNAKKPEIEKIILEMIDNFNYDMRGLQIIKINDSYQLCTRPEHFPWIKQLSKPTSDKNLSNAALETLSIIAYKQPVIKADIESIRGVKCDTAIYTLLDKNMIKELGRLERVGRPILYGTTEDFLKVFGLENLEDLPPLERGLIDEDINNKKSKPKED